MWKFPNVIWIYRKNNPMKQLLIPMCPHIMANRQLDLLDKLILSYIKNWESKGQTCYAKNSFFSELFGESQDAISLSIAKLVALKLLRSTTVPGGRCLQYEIPIPVQQPEINIFEI